MTKRNRNPENDRIWNFKRKLLRACKKVGLFTWDGSNTRPGSACCPMFALAKVQGLGNISTAFQDKNNITHDEMFSFIEQFDNKEEGYYNFKNVPKFSKMGLEFRQMRDRGEFNVV